jgi:predicted  nucleic acid-binding Zn-ribbon protein
MTTTEQAVIDALRQKKDTLAESARAAQSFIVSAESNLNTAMCELANTNTRLGEMEHDLAQLEAELKKREGVVA